MKKLILAFIIFNTSLFAQQVTIDMSKIDPELAKQIVKEQQKIDNKQTITPEKVTEWAQIGKAVGEVIKTTAKTINVEANDFAKSDLGKTVMWLVIYEYVGKGWIKTGGSIVIFDICVCISNLFICKW